MPKKESFADKYIRLHGKRAYQRLLKDLKQFDEDCEKGLVASGGWCKCCERYDCGRGGPNHT